MQKNFKEKSFKSEIDKLDVYYKKNFLSEKEADVYFRVLEDKLQYNSAESSKVKIFGKEIPIPRKQVAYGEPGTFYNFSGIKVDARSWNIEEDEVCRVIREVKSKVEERSGVVFNFVLINRYENGEQYIGFHTDDENDLDGNSPIVGVSLGAERDFQFKAKKIPVEHKQVIELTLHHGSFISMNHPTNKNWSHSLPKRLRVKRPRISLTFRKMVRQ